MEKTGTAKAEKQNKQGGVLGEMQALAKQRFTDPDFTLRTAYRELHYNYGYLSGAFKRRLGVSFSEYVSALRLSRAAELLSGGTDSVSTVAKAVGFRDPLYFSKAFKSRFGLSPSEYRKKEGEAKDITQTAPDWYSRFYVK